jgi:hypothetical protein
VTLLTARSKSGRPVNAVTGEPEDTVAVYGKEDLDRRLAAAADDPDIEVSTRPAPRTEDPELPDASRNPQPITTTASPTTQGEPVAADTNYTTVLNRANARAAEAEQDAALLGIRLQTSFTDADGMQAAEVDSASLSAQAELIERLTTAKKAVDAVGEQAKTVASVVQRGHGGIQAAVDDAPIAQPAQPGFYTGS